MKKLLTLWRAENHRIDSVSENLILSSKCDEPNLTYNEVGSVYSHGVDDKYARVDGREQIIETKQTEIKTQPSEPTQPDNSAYICASSKLDGNDAAQTGSYFGTSALIHAKRRITWLIILMLSATLTGLIISKYESQIAAVPMLVTFIPMIMDTSGNCGSQSSTLIIRGVALDEIRPRDWMRVLLKELCVGILIGVALAIVNAARVYIQYHGEEQVLGITLTVSLTLIGAVVCAKLIGSLLPLIAVKFKLDPALMASPLITTIADTASILLYFKIALSILKI